MSHSLAFWAAVTEIKHFNSAIILPFPTAFRLGRSQKITSSKVIHVIIFDLYLEGSYLIFHTENLLSLFKHSGQREQKQI